MNELTEIEKREIEMLQKEMITALASNEVVMVIEKKSQGDDYERVIFNGISEYGKHLVEKINTYLKSKDL